MQEKALRIKRKMTHDEERLIWKVAFWKVVRGGSGRHHLRCVAAPWSTTERVRCDSLCFRGIGLRRPHYHQAAQQNYTGAVKHAPQKPHVLSLERG